MEFSLKFKNLSHVKAKPFVFLMGLIVIIHLFFQSVTLPRRNALFSLLSNGEEDIDLKLNEVDGVVMDSVVLDDKDPIEQTFERSNNSTETVTVVTDSLATESGVSGEGVQLLKEDSESLRSEKFVERNNQTSSGDHSELMENQASNGNGSHGTSSDSQAFTLGREDLLIENSALNNSESKFGDEGGHMGRESKVENSRASTLRREDLLIENSLLNNSESKLGDEGGHMVRESEVESYEDERELPHDNVDTESNISTVRNNEMLPNSVVTLDRMNQMLAQHFKLSRSMKPQRASSPRDMEILDAKSKILNAPVTQNTGELYAPLFRNISMFMRSYELMERTLKVYVYRDGEKPIFHQPVLKGLYASEGWFMKLMEASRHFMAKNPRKAHLFYMPFSSRMLEHSLYVPNSYNRTNLRQFMKKYSDKIATKYPFWNRTGGMDHFLVACHDWALYETEHMENSIRALCNADITIGFKIGWDVSLPETFIRFARNPLRDVGGKAPSERSILAFYSGNNHGYLRPLLLKHLKDKYADMRIYGPMPRGIAKRMSYIKHMKNSKYCLCPRGFEVNSPRIVEAIFYECVPVIISDNFIPPFFEVLNWEAFSVIVPEKDVPRLREILLSIPEKRYLEMQLAVRKVQRHFLWHARPLKYDLFHMTLHSIWFSRVFQIRPSMRVKIGSYR